MTDLVTFGETMLRLSPPGNERIEGADRFDVRAVGPESNVAIAAGRLGADAAWLSKLPDSPLGHRIENGLHGFGLDMDVVWSRDDRQGVYYIEHGGQPRGTEVIFDRANSAITDVTPEELPTGRIKDAQYFFTTGVTPALSNRLADTTAKLLSAASKAGVRTVFDLNYRSKLWNTSQARAMVTKLFPGVSVFVASAEDARHVLDLEGQEPPEMAHHLASKWDFDTVVITKGARGALALHNSVVHEQEAVEVPDPVETIGTGDAFNGGYLAALLEGQDVPTALKYGVGAAALKLTIPGGVPTITRAEVDRVIEDEDRRVRR